MTLIKAYIALGSNIEPKAEYLAKARELIAATEAITVVDCSELYVTDPVGYTDQDAFLNQVIAVETTLLAHELLNKTQSIEQQLGRKRDIRWGPRTIDLDILLYDSENIESEHLVVPHPRMIERAFVLVPLSDIAKEVNIPGEDLTVQQALAKLDCAEIEGVRLFKLEE